MVWRIVINKGLEFQRWWTNRDSLHSSHPIQVVGMLTHANNLGNDGNLCPFDTKDFGQLLEVCSSGFAYAKHSVSQPGHTQVPELVVEKWFAQLRCEKRNILDDRLPDAPRFVLCQFDDGRQKAFGQELNVNHWKKSESDRNVHMLS